MTSHRPRRRRRIGVALGLIGGSLLLAACGGAGESETTAMTDQRPEFVRSPYLTRVDERSARLRWIAPAGARVRVIARDASGTAVRARRGDLVDLTPATDYHWIATIDGSPAAEGAFTTAPNDLNGPLDLIAFGDSGADNDASRAVAALSATEPAQLLLGMGDNAYPLTTPRTLDRLIFGPLGATLARMPHYGTVGEHDITIPAGQTALSAAYEWPERGERYALRYGPVQVIALGLQADEEDVPFLRRALARPGPLARFVVVHRPPQPGNPILPLIDRGPVTAVLAGHLHAYERRELADAPAVPFLTVGTGGAPRSSDPRHTPRSAEAVAHLAEFGLLRIGLRGARVDYRFVTVDGRTHDHFSAPLIP